MSIKQVSAVMIVVFILGFVLFCNTGCVLVFGSETQDYSDTYNQDPYTDSLETPDQDYYDFSNYLDISNKLNGCEMNGIPLYGKVKFVESFPDFEIEVVTSFPDLKVKMVNAFADSCGEWRAVESFPDFTVKIVNSFPDFTIRYVESFPGLP